MVGELAGSWREAPAGEPRQAHAFAWACSVLGWAVAVVRLVEPDGMAFPTQSISSTWWSSDRVGTADSGLPEGQGALPGRGFREVVVERAGEAEAAEAVGGLGAVFEPEDEVATGTAQGFG